MRVFEKWRDEDSVEKNLEMILPEQLHKVIERFYVCVDGKEIDSNQTTSRVPLQPLIQSTAAVSTDVPGSQGHAGQANA